MPTVFDVANYFIVKSHCDCEEGLNDDVITHLKLQKLVYYAQGFCLAMLGYPLFEQEIEAWEHGPVCRELYQKYRSFGRELIDSSMSLQEAEAPFSKDEINVLELVDEYFGCLTASGLRKLSHEDFAWQEARMGNSENGMFLSLKSMKKSCEARIINDDA
jgi:uncharacterized phage-associated protein